jgi:hypothetical protein
MLGWLCCRVVWGREGSRRQRRAFHSLSLSVLAPSLLGEQGSTKVESDRPCSSRKNTHEWEREQNFEGRKQKVKVLLGLVRQKKSRTACKQ